jgi:hypothetical protein
MTANYAGFSEVDLLANGGDCHVCVQEERALVMSALQKGRTHEKIERVRQFPMATFSSSVSNQAGAWRSK